MFLFPVLMAAGFHGPSHALLTLNSRVLRAILL